MLIAMTASRELTITSCKVRINLTPFLCFTQSDHELSSFISAFLNRGILAELLGLEPSFRVERINSVSGCIRHCPGSLWCKGERDDLAKEHVFHVPVCIPGRSIDR